MARPASADPLFAPPTIGRLTWGGGDDDPAVVGLVAEARILGVTGASRLAAWPDRMRGIEPGTPELDAARFGLVAHLRCARVSFGVQLDPAELSRADVELGEGEPAFGALTGGIVDDAWMLWRPVRPAWLLVGRARMPWSKMRQFQEVDLPLGAPPFLIDRVAPDRRWGVSLLGDLGSMSYMAGVWEDLDALEPRARIDDPSKGGAVAVAAHLEWTPRAPMMGSNPPGRVVGARGPAPTPRGDPWWSTGRVSLGFGTLLRVREDGTSRTDASLSAQWKWKAVAAIAEGVLSVQSGEQRLGGWGQVMVAPVDRVVITGFGEWDEGAGAAGAWTAGGGITWFSTRDRRNKVAFVGWFRRDVDRGTAYDAGVVLLQAAL